MAMGVSHGRSVVTGLERSILGDEAQDGGDADLASANLIRVWDYYKERVFIESYKKQNLAFSLSSASLSTTCFRQLTRALQT
jgi:hypothetical protein